MSGKPQRKKDGWNVSDEWFRRSAIIKMHTGSKYAWVRLVLIRICPCRWSCGGLWDWCLFYYSTMLPGYLPRVSLFSFQFYNVVSVCSWRIARAAVGSVIKARQEKKGSADPSTEPRHARKSNFFLRQIAVGEFSEIFFPSPKRLPWAATTFPFFFLSSTADCFSGKRVWFLKRHSGQQTRPEEFFCFWLLHAWWVV